MKEHKLRTYFLTGFVLLLPLVLTVMIVLFVVNILTNPFVGSVEATFNHYGIFNKPFLFLSGTQVLHLTSKLTVLIALLLITIGVGFLGGIVIINYIFKVGDYLLHRIPLVNKVYKAAQDVVTTIFSSKGKSFSKVVLVPFPHSQSYNIGLITSSSMAESSDLAHKDFISVFVPGTPNPTMGFMLLLKKEQLIPVDMKVEEALKFLVSCGVMCPKFNTAPAVPPFQDVAGK